MSDNVSEKDQQCVIEVIGGITEEESKFFDDDGRPKRSGTVMTTSAHIITTVIGSGVLSLSWAIAQLGWVAGPVVLVLFLFVSYYTSSLLAYCYRSEDPITGKRNYTYMEVVQTNLELLKDQVVFMKRVMIIHAKYQGLHTCSCLVPYKSCSLKFLTSIRFHGFLWKMSFTYSTIGLGLGIAKVAENGKIKGSLTGISIGNVTPTQKIWRFFQVFGAIAFAYSYSLVLVEIQDTVKAPVEYKTMKKASMLSVVITTIFYMLCGCFGYAAFGDMAPGNLLTGFGFFDPYWLVDIANVAIVIHLVGAYQVFCLPLFAFVESTAVKYFPESKFINDNIEIPIPVREYNPFKLNIFQLLWRSAFVCMTTLIALLIPFFNDVVGILGAFRFWPLTVYFPIEIYIVQKKIPTWSARWILLQTLSVICLLISVCAAIGSIAGVVSDLKTYKPFKPMS